MRLHLLGKIYPGNGQFYNKSVDILQMGNFVRDTMTETPSKTDK